MRPQDVFDITHRKVRELQHRSSVRAISMEPRTTGGPARVGDASSEFIADFKLAAKRALKRWPKQYRLFLIYFMHFPPNASFGEEIRNAELLNQHGKTVREELKLKEGTFYPWITQIREKVGREIARSGLFPPRKYQERKVEAVTVDD